MHQDRSHGREDRRPEISFRNEATTSEQDAAIQAAVIALVFERHPAQMTVAELQREIVADPGSYSQNDAVERAVRDLAGVGLLHRHGEFAIPTVAAIHFHGLLDRLVG
ncbi:MAG TPA: hypothetical protein VG518_10170 [Solirubrobacterales bacterium]|nr:hypothetical protein [Solirubrobacterales bacterium]